MTARLKSAISATRRLWALLVIFAALVFLMKTMAEQSAAKAPAAQSRKERVFENLIKKNVPIKVKIKKEKEESFKDLKNEKWVREFELEVTNTGDKPIYFLDIDLVTDVKVGGEPLVFTLIYGRAELGDVISKAGADDVPIRPGESYVFLIHSGQVPAWEQSVREGNHAEATKILVALQMLSFGDGTGYVTNETYPSRSLSTLERRLDRSFNDSRKKLP